MSGVETSLSGTDNNSLALRYTPGYESVFINGVLQVRGSDYVATTGTTVTGLIALTASDVVMVESIIAYSVGDTYTQTTLDGKFSPITTTGLVLLNTTTFSASSSIAIDNVFSAAYDNYKIETVGVGSTGTSFVLQMRTSAGVDVTAANYDYYGVEATSVSGPSRIYQPNATFGQIATSGSSSFAFSLDIFRPFLATETNGVSVNISNGVYNILNTFGFTHKLANSYAGIKFFPVSGTATGTIKIYGYK
jgi:hypothetical protein